MDIFAKEFWLPKSGSSASEYEDASAVAKDKSRFAVADGATETSFSGVWAKQLVRAFTDKRLSVPIGLEELKPLQSKWQKIVHRHPLPWYAEEKAYDGAFAAFVGLEFLDEYAETGPQKIWRATAAGDSCLIQVRNDEIVQAFPLANSASFNDRPNILCSAIGGNGTCEVISKSGGHLLSEDAFFLMTDAIACWFFKEYEQGNKPWNLLDTQDDASFEKFVSRLRSENKMKDDDVTLVQVDVIA